MICEKCGNNEFREILGKKNYEEIMKHHKDNILSFDGNEPVQLTCEKCKYKFYFIYSILGGGGGGGGTGKKENKSGWTH